MRRWRRLLTMALLTVWIVTGCAAGQGRGGTGEPAERTSSGPVTIKVGTTPSASISDEDFQRLFVEPVQAKYPNITPELVRYGDGATYQDWVATGTTPDMIMIWNGELGTLKTLNILEDITPLVKKAKLDLNRFEPTVLDAVRAFSDHGELYGLPYVVQLNALYYNRDLFDKFGIGYPKDGMTWEETVELGRKLTRMDGGVQYRGLDPEQIMRVAYPLSLNVVNAKTNKAEVDNDRWKKVFRLMNDIYSIPGNQSTAGYTQAFMKDRNVAMLASINLFDQLASAAASGFTDWDVAQYPSYPENPDTYGMVDTHVLVVSSTSQAKEQAMQVIGVVTSDEVQSVSARQSAKLSPLANPELKQAFGAEVPSLQGKHVQSIFKSKPAPAPAFSIYFAEARDLLKSSFNDYIGGKTDANTALRTAEENINQMLSEKSVP